jgi:Flp pilus assembly protein TadG
MDGCPVRCVRPTHARCHDRLDRGAAAVEFALVSLLLCTVLFGILQYGLYFWQLQGGAAAAREAARQSAVGMWDCSALQSQTTSRVPAGGAVTVNRTYIAADGAATTSPETGDDVKVTVSFNTVAVGLVPMPNNGVVLSEARARVETVTASTGTC